MGSTNCRLHFQVYFLPIEQVEHQPARHNIAQCKHHCAPPFGQQSGHTAQEELRHALEAHNLLEHIDCNGVDTNDAEKARPTAVATDVYDVVEDGKLASLYPSMATDFVTVTADEQITAVQLMALSGKVYKPAYTEDGLVDVAPYEPGLYLLVVRFETFERAFKVIKL